MKVSIRDLLSRSRSDVVLLDGGTGTSLEDRGVDVRSDLWGSRTLLSAAGLAVTRRLHVDFFAAGADVVIANTHNVNRNSCRAFLRREDLGEVEAPPGLLEGDPDEREERFLRWIEDLGVEVVERAVPSDRDVVVAAGIGSEEPWATRTARTPDEIAASIAPAARALARSGDTFVVFETLSTAPEIAAVADLVRREDLRDVGLGLSCGPDGRTWGGVSMTEVLGRLEGASVAAVFVQCTRYDVAGIAVRDLVAALDRAPDLDAVPGVYANDGRVWRDRRWHGERISPGTYADAAEEWRAAGARIIGGCCGTTPEHVAELRRRWQ